MSLTNVDWIFPAPFSDLRIQKKLKFPFGAIPPSNVKYLGVWHHRFKGQPKTWK